MDPINALVLSAPPEWIPILVLAALLLKAFTAWLDRKKTTQLLEAVPMHVEPESEVEEIQKPDVKG